MEKLSPRLPRNAKQQLKYLILFVALICFAAGMVWYEKMHQQDIFTSSYHGASISNEHQCLIKVNVTFDTEDQTTLMKMMQEKNGCSTKDAFVKAESYIEIKTMSLEKHTFAKATITGAVQKTAGSEKFKETRFMPITLQRSHGNLVLIVSNKDVFPLNVVEKEMNDKLVFILIKDRT